MNIKCEISIRKCICAILAMAVSIGYALSTYLSLKFAVALPVMLFLGFFIRIEIKWKWLDVVAVAASSFIALTIMQLETGSVINDLGIKKMLFNWLLTICVFLIILTISNRLSYTCKIGSIVLFAIGFADALVIAFRGNQISVSDIYSIRTALSVVGNYKMTWNPMFVFAIVIFCGYIMCLWKVTFATEKIGKIRFVSIPFIFIIAIFIVTNIQGYQVATWANKGCTFNGVFLEWVLEARDLNVREPEGYTAESVEKILNDYTKEKNVEDRTPNIIVVMSEAYSDLSVLGDIETSKDVMPNFHELCKESIHGYALSSVFGGNTAVSEWEFLTGSSMAFMPAGSVAYQQYVKEGDNSLVSLLKRRGYRTVAMHPYLASGWSRSKAYKNLGFDEFLSIDDFKQEKLVRSYVSDEEFYEMVISKFEEKESDIPLFVYGITMQNHGGYVYEGFENVVEATTTEKEYSDLNQYLSLINITDAALPGFIDYFRNYDEDVIIVFFGDHQPNLNDEFYKEVAENVEFDKYKVPFFVWSNYATEEEGKDIGLTSLNYLSTIMLEEAEIPMPPYYQYLSDLQKKIPAIHEYGYYDGKDYNRIENLEQNTSEILDEYWMLQYANVFGTYEGSELFN